MQMDIPLFTIQNCPSGDALIDAMTLNHRLEEVSIEIFQNRYLQNVFFQQCETATVRSLLINC